MPSRPRSSVPRLPWLALVALFPVAACSSSSGGEQASADGGDGSTETNETGTDATMDGTTDDAPSDGTAADTTQADAGQADSSPTDSGQADAAVDGSHADAAAIDSGPSDATSGDATPPDGSLDAAPDAPVDGPADAAADVLVDAGCTSTMAVLGGGATFAFSATFASGQWSSPASIGSSGYSGAALVATGGLWLGTAQGPANALVSTSFATGASSPLVQIGAAVTQGSPALVANATSGWVAYWGTDYKFYDGLNTAGAWDTAGDPVGGATAQAFGSSGPTAALVGSEFVVAQCGSDDAVHVESLIGGTWGATVVVSGAAVEPTESPTLVALSGGSAELLLVAPGQTSRELYFATRTSGTWSTLQPVGGSTVFTSNPVSLAALGGGQAALVYMGGDGKPYVTLYNPAPTPAWSTVASLVSGINPTLASPPIVAPGVCGAQAIVALVPTGGGGVELTSLSGGAWSTPASLSGTATATFAGIATAP
jgi:hypothetical protein